MQHILAKQRCYRNYGSGVQRNCREINELLLAKDDKKQTAFHLAARFGEEALLLEIFNWIIEKMSTEEINELFLAKDDRK